VERTHDRRAAHGITTMVAFDFSKQVTIPVSQAWRDAIGRSKRPAARIPLDMTSAALALHFTLSTSSVQARDDLRAACFWSYAYNGDAAYSAFRGRDECDPVSRGRYAGEALAVGPDLNRPLNQARLLKGKRRSLRR